MHIYQANNEKNHAGENSHAGGKWKTINFIGVARYKGYSAGVLNPLELRIVVTPHAYLTV